jgi:nickel transport protein
LKNADLGVFNPPSGNMHRSLLMQAINIIIFLFFILGWTVSPSMAHDLWLERENGDHVLYQGHRHSNHAGDDRVAYEPEIVKAITCADEAGARRTIDPPTAYPARIAGPCAALHVLTSTGYWTRTTQGLRNQPRSELNGVIRSWESLTGIKRLNAWSPALAAPLSEALEITPLADPAALAPGSPLRLLITLAGQPQEGVAITRDGEFQGVSDATGQVSVRLKRGGLRFLSARFEEPRADGLADTTLHYATLMLELPE